MSRIRSIKPEIIEDEKTANLDDLEWRLFVSLFVIADDYGNLRGNAGYIHGSALWASRHSRETVAKALETLVSTGLVELYEVRGQVYLHISGWEKHQRVDKPGKPHCPGPGEREIKPSRNVDNVSRNPRETFAESSRDIRESLAPDPDLRSPISDLRRERETRAGQAPDDTRPAPATADARKLARLDIERNHGDRFAWVKAKISAEVPALNLVGEGERWLVERLQSRGDTAADLEQAIADCRHVLVVREVQAVKSASLRYFGATVWKSDEFSWALARTPADFDRPARAGPGSGPPKPSTPKRPPSREL
ncbi:MAG: hypothetical protein H0U46_05610 [Actinobacteria bacterium]|nr:hypothetical protein [Actinomycetota bacterium]